MFTKHCFQPALRSCGFLRTVSMTCRAIITCQPSYYHCLPSLACQASCTSPAFAVVRRTWDAAIPTDSSFSSQSLLLPLHIAANNTELLTPKDRNEYTLFSRSSCFLFSSRMSSQLALLHGTLKYQKETVPFSVVQ